MARKTQTINKVIIENKIITVFDQNNNQMKVTRAQRNVLSNYSDPNYKDNIKKAFDNPKILGSEFVVIVNGTEKEV